MTMDRRLIAGMAVGAAAPLAVARLGNRPALAAVVAAGMGAAGVYAYAEPDLIIAFAVVVLVVAVIAN
jgi:hypothetical protein